MPWYNNDGLNVRFDAEKIVAAPGGEYPGAGATRVLEMKIDISKLTTSSALIAGDGLIFPRNSRIDKVEVIAETAVATITSLTIGLNRIDRTTVLDVDGFVAALPVANMSTQGETTNLTAEVTYAGSSVGQTLAYPGIPVANIAGSAGTGIVKVRVHLYVPGKDANPTNY